MKKNFLLIIFALFLLFPLFAQRQRQTNTPDTRAATGDLSGALAALDSALAVNEEPTLMDEYHLGRAVAANILTVYRPYTGNPQLTRYLNMICQVIAINSPAPEIFNGYSVIILDSLEFNAFATPGGHIMITKGLVEAATSEDMLAAIIAHEFAHILLKHSSGIIAHMRLSQDLSATADRAGQIAAGESSVAARAVLFRDSVTRLIDVMMKSGYSQAQEFEADRAAITLLAAAGYNPGALVEILRVLQRVQGSQAGGFNSTHPTPAMRINNAEQTSRRYRVRDTSSFRASRFADTAR